MTSLVKFRIALLSVIVAGAIPFIDICAQEVPAESVAMITPNRQKLKVALIVSPKGSELWKAAEPLRAGIYAAYAQKKNDYDLVEFTLSDPTKIEEVLNSVADSGALLALGPLARQAVENLSELSYLPLPVVAINRPKEGAVPELLLAIDMSAESEAEQLAKIAVESTADKNSGGSFVIFTTQDSYDQRVARAIDSALRALGVHAERRTVTSVQLSYLTQEMRGKAFRGVFFAMNAQQASLLRPFIPRELPLFGTSYTNPMHQTDSMQAKTQSTDLIGMVTLELPAESLLSLSEYSKFSDQYSKMGQDQREMFSVGLDAWRIGEQWLQWRKNFDYADGMSGKISYVKDQSPRVKRQLNKAIVDPARAGDGSEEVVDFIE